MPVFHPTIFSCAFIDQSHDQKKATKHSMYKKNCDKNYTKQHKLDAGADLQNSMWVCELL
jgi:hypothetical protein